MNVDFGKTAEDYGKHRGGFPEGLYDRLALRGIGERGQRVADLGTGTGNLARGFAKRGCEVVGVDPSKELIAEAERLDKEHGTKIHYVVSTAERTTLDESSFDVVCAGQAWHWFDRRKAVREVKRVLRPGGRLVIAHFDWIPLEGNAVEATETLIEKYNPEWDLGGGSGVHSESLTDVRSAGFVEVETFSFDVMLSFSHESWRGRVRASAGVQATLASDEVARFDENLRRLMVDSFPEPLLLPHCVWALTCRAPS